MRDEDFFCVPMEPKFEEKQPLLSKAEIFLIVANVLILYWVCVANGWI